MKTLFTLLLVMAATLADARQTVRLQVFECGRYHFDDVSLFGLSNAETPTRDRGSGTARAVALRAVARRAQGPEAAEVRCADQVVPHLRLPPGAHEEFGS